MRVGRLLTSMLGPTLEIEGVVRLEGLGFHSFTEVHF